jgi:hypothetical protein
MKVLVCGGRDFCEVDQMEYELNFITNPAHGGKWSFDLVTGMADGADTLAYQWAQKHGVNTICYPADWKTFGKRAGYLRNKQMLDCLLEAKEEGEDVLVVAFPGGKGTAMMVKLATEAGVEVVEIK